MQASEIETWLQDHLPPELQAAAPLVQLYDDEIVILLQVDPLTSEDSSDSASCEQATIAALREQSRPLRIKLARTLQQRFQLPVAWSMVCGSQKELFSSRTVPVMTRLDRRERDVLDTLVGAGVAETRSSALAYTVRAFAEAHTDWLKEVGAAIEQVQQIRSKLHIQPKQGPPNIPSSQESEQ